MCQFSGECVRQLFQIINKALTIALGGKITEEIFNTATKKLGQQNYEQLENNHLKILKEGTFNTADKEIREMLYSLALLKYNGDELLIPL